MIDNRHLRTIINSGELVIAPGVYDMFSALMADKFDFQALYMTGYGVSASHLGVPDVGLVTYTDMVNRAATIAHKTKLPLIADADTGFGGLVNVRYTVQGYERAGVQAIQIEDQVMPKRCGHTQGRQVLSADEMVRKINVAADSRNHDETLIIARTDARTALGLDEAIARGNMYARAGADIIFVEAPESADEFKRIGNDINAWSLANIVPSGLSPEIDSATLRDWGFDIVIYPTVGMVTATAALRQAYLYLETHANMLALDVPALTMDELHELVGFEEVWELEQRYATPNHERAKDG